MIDKAQKFAEVAHKGQKRKSSDEDYINHPIRVARILKDAGGSESLICACLLHDVVEDTAYELEDIEREFGGEVRNIVAAHTEDKSKPWDERKAHTIEVVKTGSLDVKSLIVADKLDNLLSIEESYHQIGNAVWNYFNSGCKKQKWYYQSVAAHMHSGIIEKDTPSFFTSYAQAVERFFK
ncbi:HD domain-containing protein [Halobacillus sp. A5]|uniref:HD domain-containing protein n=1 Tax=Halobacillus sp. A5 TaxID=2880263 RepID=UPI0020A6ADF7|nr:HD domain-containing protein [Halobacillus sp. A5]MCP3029401.1 HD domain-containing protein [Halobacillus sp. A5]